MTKKEFKEKCSFHTYVGYHPRTRINAIYFGYESSSTETEWWAGYKYMVAGNAKEIGKTDLFNQLYEWYTTGNRPEGVTRTKYAETDKERFKVPLSFKL